MARGRPGKLTDKAKMRIAGFRRVGSAVELAMLGIILRAAANGDNEAAAWLNGEGSIVVTESGSSFRPWDERDGRGSPKAVEWRNAVFSRDGYRCTRCGKRGALQAHHVEPWASNVPARFDVGNGVTLCPECHAGEHPGRENLIRHARYTGVKTYG